MSNNLPFSIQDTSPDFSTFYVLEKLWAKTYNHGSFYFDRTKGKMPPRNFTFQKNDNLDLLFNHGNVQYIKVIMSVQYYAKEDLAVIVLRIHSDTFNQFKQLISELRATHKKVDGVWTLRNKVTTTENLGEAGENNVSES